MHPKELRYSPEHVWLRDEGGGRFRLGLTYRYQEQVKSVVYLELPRVGNEIKRGEAFGAIESSKVSTDLVSPIDGTVLEVNALVAEKPGLVNKDPYGQGWLILTQAPIANAEQTLMSAEEYLAAVSGGEAPWQQARPR